MVVSEGKHVLWEWRTDCLRKQMPRLASDALFMRLLSKNAAEVKAFKCCLGEEKTKEVWGGGGGGVAES